MDNAVPQGTSSSFFCICVSSQRIPGCMKFEGYKISGVKVVNIMEENAEAIEKNGEQSHRRSLPAKTENPRYSNYRG